jgi:hypothetical protein
VFGVGSKGLERCPDTLEQQAVDHLWVQLHQGFSVCGNVKTRW